MMFVRYVPFVLDISLIKHMPRGLGKKMIYVQWRKTCYMCQCPLNVEVDFDFDDDEHLWKLCMEFVPGEERFLKNKLYYKKLGGHVYPTCKSCFNLKLVCNPAIIRDIEVGVLRRKRPQPEGYTKAELGEWVHMCERFIHGLRSSDNFRLGRS
jgi:hypothetical protein